MKNTINYKGFKITPSKGIFKVTEKGVMTTMIFSSLNEAKAQIDALVN